MQTIQAPQVSVIMSVYNGAAYLREAVDSILNQSFTDFEFLIVDDASTDSSLQILNSYSDPRVRLLRNTTNLGLTRSLNIAVAQARGQFIARMDADDVALPERLSRQIAYLEQHPEVGVLAGLVQQIDVTGNPLPDTWPHLVFEHREIAALLPRTNCLAHPTVVVRSEWFRRYPYNEQARTAQDYVLWLQLLARGVVFAKLPYVVLFYRRHPDTVGALTGSSIAKRINKPLAVYRLFLGQELRQFRFGLVFWRVVPYFLVYLGLGFFHRLFPGLMPWYLRHREQLPTFLRKYA